MKNVVTFLGILLVLLVLACGIDAPYNPTPVPTTTPSPYPHAPVRSGEQVDE